jgi:hypothetical protein
MIIVAWLKKKLRGWLLDEPEDNSLECRVRSKGHTIHRSFVIIGSRGLYLIGTSSDLDGPSQMLLSVEAALNQNRWWTIWKRFNAGTSIEWEDGDAQTS